MKSQTILCIFECRIPTYLC